MGRNVPRPAPHCDACRALDVYAGELEELNSRLEAERDEAVLRVGALRRALGADWTDDAVQHLYDDVTAETYHAHH